MARKSINHGSCLKAGHSSNGIGAGSVCLLTKKILQKFSNRRPRSTAKHGFRKPISRAVNAWLADWQQRLLPADLFAEIQGSRHKPKEKCPQPAAADRNFLL